MTGTYCQGGSHIHAYYFDTKSMNLMKIWHNSNQCNEILLEHRCLLPNFAYEAVSKHF